MEDSSPSNEDDIVMTDSSSSLLLDALLQAASSQDMTQLALLLSPHEEQQQGVQPSSTGNRTVEISKWMEPLIMQLLCISTITSTTTATEQQQQQEQQQQALILVGTLARLQPDVYLLPVAKAVARQMDRIVRTTELGRDSTASSSSFFISQALLEVWIHQLTQTSQVAVHTYLLQALIQAIQLQGSALADPSLHTLTHVWNHHWQQQQTKTTTATDRHASSIVAVRCATILISLIDALGDIAMIQGQNAGATRLFAQMLHVQQQEYNDPLLQLSILDLLSSQHFPITTKSTQQQWPSSLKAWLISPDIMTPLLQLLNPTTADPLLTGSALHSASWVVAVANSATTTTTPSNLLQEEEFIQAAQPLCQQIFNYIKNEVGTTSNETDRLAVVQALVQLASSSSLATTHHRATIGHGTATSRRHRLLQQYILQDNELRSAWWDMTRISSPKLQAAILSSIAQVLRALGAPAGGDANATATAADRTNNNIDNKEEDEDESGSSRIGIRIYTLLCTDNTRGGAGGRNEMNHNTTDWLYAKFIQSPMPELRIATYAIWEALLALNGTIGITTLSASQHFWNHNLESRHREMTAEARIAKYQVLETIHTKQQGFLAKGLQTKLEQLLALGPHGFKGQPYDVAVE